MAARVIVAARTVLQRSLAFYVVCREGVLSETCGTCVDWVIRGAFVIDWPTRTGVNDACVRTVRDNKGEWSDSIPYR